MTVNQVDLVWLSIFLYSNHCTLYYFLYIVSVGRDKGFYEKCDDRVTMYIWV